MAGERPEVDFTLEKPGDGIRLLVEAKNTTAPSPDWAARFLRNLFVQAAIPPSEYFLLALRNHFYLWRHPVPEAGPPDFEADTAAALRPYLGRMRGGLDTLSASGFQLLIQAWLGDLVAGTLSGADIRQWAEDSGLAEAVRDSSIRASIAA